MTWPLAGMINRREDQTMIYIVRLLKAAVEREGGQTAFAKRHRVHRSSVNRVLKGKLPASGRIAKALGLRKVYVAE